MSKTLKMRYYYFSLETKTCEINSNIENNISLISVENKTQQMV